MNTRTTKTEKTRHSNGVTVPPPLATPTDLTSQEVQAVTDTVNPLIADAIALYVKLKNFHWHVVGSHFRDYHVLFDEHAAELLASIDPLAERIRRVGGTTIRSLGHVQQLTGIEDDDHEFVTPDAMINRLIKDNLHMAKQLRSAIELTEEKRDMPTNDLLMELLDATEKRIWFLHEISQGGENME
jgi:starvation-inducible DNA-binding protein